MSTSLPKVEVHIENDLKEWVIRHSRREGYHTVSAYVRWLLMRERREMEAQEKLTRAGGRE